MEQERKFFELLNGLVDRNISEKRFFYLQKKTIDDVVLTNHDRIGHLGVAVTAECISRVYYFPDMKGKVGKCN